MTRSLQRQFEEEVSVQKNFGIDPKDLNPNEMFTPREDDTYSPLHDEHEDEPEARPETVAPPGEKPAP